MGISKEEKKRSMNMAFVGSFFLGFAVAMLLNRLEVAPFLAIALAFIGYSIVGLRG